LLFSDQWFKTDMTEEGRDAEIGITQQQLLSDYILSHVTYGKISCGRILSFFCNVLSQQSSLQQVLSELRISYKQDECRSF
jgi:hypothetical protein